MFNASKSNVPCNGNSRPSSAAHQFALDRPRLYGVHFEAGPQRFVDRLALPSSKATGGMDDGRPVLEPGVRSLETLAFKTRRHQRFVFGLRTLRPLNVAADESRHREVAVCALVPDEE